MEDAHTPQTKRTTSPKKKNENINTLKKFLLGTSSCHSRHKFPYHHFYINLFKQRSTIKNISHRFVQIAAT